MNVQHVGPYQSIRFTLPDGDAGVADTIAYIRQLVDEGLSDPRIRRVATEVLRHAGVAPYDDFGEIRAIFDWAVNWRNMRFVRDPVGKEMLQPAWSILESGAGDCDCINAILLPSLLGAIGYATRAVTIATDPADRRAFSHIYIEALVEDGNGGTWIPLDVARPGARWGRNPERFYRLQRWPLMEAADMPISGNRYLNGPHAYPRRASVGRKSVMPRFGLGQDDSGGVDYSEWTTADSSGGYNPDDGSTSGFDWTGLASILKTVPNIETGAAQIVKSTQQGPTSPGAYTGGIPTAGSVASGSSIMPLLLIGGLAILGISAMKK